MVDLIKYYEETEKKRKKKNNKVQVSSAVEEERNPVSVAKRQYSNYNDGVQSLLKFSRSQLNSAINDVQDSKDYFKSKVMKTNDKYSFLYNKNSQSLAPENKLYRNQELKNLNNPLLKYSQANKYKKDNISSVSSRADMKYNSAKDIFKSDVKTSNDYKKYDEYAYNALPLLKQAKLVQEVNEKETNLGDKIFAPFLGQATRGFKYLLNSDGEKYRLANGNEVMLDTKTELKGQKTQNDYQTFFGKLYGTATGALGNMTPAIAAGTINPILGTTVMGVGTYNQAFDNSLKEGYTEKQANRYALANTTLELALGKALGGMTKIVGESGLSNIISKSLSKVMSNKATRDILAELGSEFTEEYLQEIIDPVVRNITLNENNEFKLFSEEALIAGLSGTINAGITNLPSYLKNKNLNQIDNNNLSNGIVNGMVANEIKLSNVNNQNNNINEYKSVNFDSDFSKFKSGNYNNNDVLRLTDTTPQSLYNLGFDEEKPIAINMNKLKKVMTSSEFNQHFHGITDNIIEQLPYAINNPLNIIKNDKMPGRYVLVTELSDDNGNIIIVPIEANSLGKVDNVEIDVNKINSIYGKETYDGNDNLDLKGYMEQNKDSIVYDIDKDIQKRAASSTLQLRKASNSFSYNNNSINNAQSQSIPLSNTNNMQKMQNNTSLSPLALSISSKTRQALKDTQNVEWLPINDITPAKNGGGYRTEEQMIKLENEIRANGITSPIEIIKKSDGTLKINDGNHRLQVAKKLGLRQVPVKYVEDYIAKAEDTNYNIDYAKGEYENGSIRSGERANSYNDGTRDIERSSDKSILLSNRRQSIQKNDSLSLEKLEYNNGSSSNTRSNSNPKGRITESNKVLNPLEISKLTPEDANTTPNLPNVTRNKVNDGESKFYHNIKDKTNMLNEQQKHTIMSDDEVKYYDKVTNKESLDKAFKKINENRARATNLWFSKDSEDADSVDVAMGWILLKQYADNNDNDGMVAVAKKLRNIGTKAGQTVQAFNIIERMTPEGMVKYAQSELLEAYDKMVKNKSKEWIDKHQSDFDLKPDEVAFIMDTMKEVSKIDNKNFAKNKIKELEIELSKEIDKNNIKAIKWEIKELKNGSLEYYKKVKLAEIQKLMTDKLPPEKGAGIKAWMRISMLFNPKTQVRNVLGNAVITPVNYFSDLMSGVVDKSIAKKTGVRTTGRTKLSSYGQGFKRGLYQSYNDFKKGINTRDMEGNKFEIGTGKSFKERTFIGKTLNKTDSLLSFMLDAGDRGFYEGTFTNSINNQLVLNNTTEVTKEMIDIATQEALSRTWQDNNDYTKFVLSARKGLNKLPSIRGYGLGDILIPFAKTPANLTKAIIDYSPAGLVNTIKDGIYLKRSLNNEQFTPIMQHKFVQELGKATAGTMLYIAGYALAKAGISSGENDDDKDTSNFLKNTLGISSYSIKIGDKTFAYDWAQPVAAPLSITANIVNSKNKSQALLEGILGNLDTAGSVLLEQSFLTSINEVLNDNNGVVSGLGNQILSLPSRAIPTFSKQIADMIDGTQRTTFEYNAPLKTATNKIKAKLPGVSKSLAPSVDSLGREIQKYGGENNLFNVFLNPANVNSENISTSAKEIYRLYKQTGDKAIMPRVANYYENKKGQKIIFTSHKKAEYQKVSGEIVENNIRKLLNNSSYQNMPDIEKAEVVKNIVNYSYNIAQKKVLGTEISQNYQKAYEYSEIGNISDYYTYKSNIDEDNKKESICNYLINSNLTDKEIIGLYTSNYSTSKAKLNNLTNLDIPIKEYLKLDKEDIESNYSSKTGNVIRNSKKNKVIEYVNKLNLSLPQRAILVKSQYKTFKSYDNSIIKYVNKLDIPTIDKKIALKSIGFKDYDNDIYNYVDLNYYTKEAKAKKLKELGFTVRNGKVYY